MSNLKEHSILKYQNSIEQKELSFLDFIHDLKNSILAIKQSFFLQKHSYRKKYFSLFNQKIDYIWNITQNFSQSLHQKRNSILIKEKNVLINLSLLIKEIYQQLEFFSFRKGIEFNFFYKEEIFIQGRKQALKKALLNLILNALIYNKDGGVVEIYLSKLKSQVKILILDTGIGIFPSEIKKIGNNFYRSLEAKKCFKQGTGLGFFLAKKIFLQHQGQIRIESEKEKGTAIIIFLPLKKSCDTLI